jgi:hypothetical protein
VVEQITAACKRTQLTREPVYLNHKTAGTVAVGASGRTVQNCLTLSSYFEFNALIEQFDN